MVTWRPRPELFRATVEGVGPLLMGLARNGAGTFDIALGVDLPG